MADQTKLRKRLEALLKKPENQVCCDCNRRGARWASANLGNFFCIECSGIHRNLGVHISFVRSVNLDTWTVKQVEVITCFGKFHLCISVSSVERLFTNSYCLYIFLLYF